MREAAYRRLMRIFARRGERARALRTYHLCAAALEQARTLHEDTLTRSRRVLGDDHPDTLASADNFARDLHAFGDLEQARTLHEDTLTRRQRVLGSNHPDTRLSAENLAAVPRKLGKVSRA